MAVTGFVFVGLSSMITSGLGDYTPTQTISGILLICLGIFFSSSQFVVQEYVLRKYIANPTRLVGLEGVYGVPISILICMIFSLIPCPGEGICNTNGSWDDPILAIIEIGRNWKLLLCFFLLLLSIKFFNLAGMIVTKNINAVVRSYLDTSRTIIVWIISLSVGFDVFVWYGFVIELFGFVLLALGTNVYSETIEVKWFGLNSQLFKYRIKEEEKINEMNLKDEENRLDVDDDESNWLKKKKSFDSLGINLSMPEHRKSSADSIYRM